MHYKRVKIILLLFLFFESLLFKNKTIYAHPWAQKKNQFQMINNIILIKEYVADIYGTGPPYLLGIHHNMLLEYGLFKTGTVGINSFLLCMAERIISQWKTLRSVCQLWKCIIDRKFLTLKV